MQLPPVLEQVILALDGALRMTVPAGHPEVSVEPVARATALEGLADDPAVEVAVAVALGPDGLQFADAPVTVSLDTGVAVAPGALPTVIAIQRDAAGWNLPVAQRISRGDSGTIVIDAEVNHFSNFIVLIGNTRFELSPAMVDAAVGEQFDVDVVVPGKTSGEAALFGAMLEEHPRRVTGFVATGSGVHGFACVGAGPGSYGYDLTFGGEEAIDTVSPLEPSLASGGTNVAEALLISALGRLGAAFATSPHLFEEREPEFKRWTHVTSLRGDARCLDELPPEIIELGEPVGGDQPLTGTVTVRRAPDGVELTFGAGIVSLATAATLGIETTLGDGGHLTCYASWNADGVRTVFGQPDGQWGCEVSDATFTVSERFPIEPVYVAGDHASVFLEATRVLPLLDGEHTTRISLYSEDGSGVRYSAAVAPLGTYFG